MYGEEEYAYVRECFSALEGHIKEIRCNIPLAQYAITSAAREEGIGLTMGYGTSGLETPVLAKCISTPPTPAFFSCPVPQSAISRCLENADYYIDSSGDDPFFFISDYPREYRTIYECHSMLLDGIATYSILCHKSGYDPDARPLESLLISYSQALSHLPDAARGVVQAFLDTVDNIVLKEIILCENCPSCRHQLWEAVHYLYDSPHCGETIWELAAPYIPSLRGPSSDYERIRSQEIYDVVTGRVGERACSLELMARRMGIYPELDELRQELCNSCKTVSDRDISLIRKATEDLD